MGRISCAAAMVAGMCAFSIARAQAPEQGKAIFESRCLACHSLTTNRVGPAPTYEFPAMNSLSEHNFVAP